MRIRKTPPKEFTVDRSKWVHGGGKNTDLLGDTSLLNEEGNMCCLGFYARACGATRESIAGYGYPGMALRVPLMGEVIRSIGYSQYTRSELCRTAMTANDTGTTNKKEKETKIKALFKEGGVKLTFVGRYPKGVV